MPEKGFLVGLHARRVFVAKGLTKLSIMTGFADQFGVSFELFRSEFLAGLFKEQRFVYLTLQIQHFMGDGMTFPVWETICEFMSFFRMTLGSLLVRC